MTTLDCASGGPRAKLSTNCENAIRIENFFPVGFLSEVTKLIATHLKDGGFLVDLFERRHCC